MSTVIETLRRMLAYCRPHDSATLRTFCDDWLRPLPGAYRDTFGNWHVQVGGDTAPPVLYSCHTDTVHRSGGYQSVIYDPSKQTLSLPPKSRSACLGADDTIGVALMHAMILAGKPGRYIFHHGEEVGCKGSKDIAKHHSEYLRGFMWAIAFDRKGSSDVITFQHSERCCSEVFATALAKQLGGTFTPSPEGLYTDTASYMSLIPECTNVSIGYSGAHGSSESVDCAHVDRLLAALLTLDPSALPCERDPSKIERRVYPVIEHWYSCDPSPRYGRTFYHGHTPYFSAGRSVWSGGIAPKCPACTKLDGTISVSLVDEEGAFYWCPVCGSTYTENDLESARQARVRAYLNSKALDTPQIPAVPLKPSRGLFSDTGSVVKSLRRRARKLSHVNKSEGK